jgi:hypothetical protein
MNGDPAKTVQALTARPAKDLWLLGGGGLLRTLLEYTVSR